MPGGSGFDLLARLEHVPRVIFTTAYDHHAVRAFEVNALDYLLKPIEPERLAAAVAKARSAKSEGTPAVRSGATIERLFIRDGCALLVRAVARGLPDGVRGQLRATPLG